MTRKPSGQLYALNYSLNSYLVQHDSWRSLDGSLKRHWQVFAKLGPKKFLQKALNSFKTPYCHHQILSQRPIKLLEFFQWGRWEQVTLEINTLTNKRLVFLPCYSILSGSFYRLLPLYDKQHKGKEGMDWMQQNGWLTLENLTGLVIFSLSSWKPEGNTSR